MQRNIRRVLTGAAALILAACGPQMPEPAADAGATSQVVDRGVLSISREALEAHLRYLADDQRKGRMTGTPEYEDAARYVAGQFESLGLEPAGDDGWYQQVPMLARRIDADSATLVYHQDDGDSALRWKEDFVMQGDTARPETEVRAEVVYAGYGINAPELGYSDYDGIDVDGKVVAIFGGAPATFPHNERAYYSSGLTKAQEAVARGAVGMLSLRSRVDQKRYPWQRIVEFSTMQPGMSWINLTGRVANYFPELEGGAILNEPAADELFRTASITYEEALDAADAGRPLSTPLGFEVTLARRTAHESIESPNVVGLLRGNDPQLANEFVVYTAHLDHVGVGTPVNGDDIYNGMYDNAMGVSLLIEAARAFTAMSERPRRSILFVAVTGEERGLLGSDYFAHYPTVPSGSIVADVNLDMPLLLYPLADIIAFGSEHSSLQQVIQSVVDKEKFTLSPDPVPEEVLFIRSDQYSFVKQGVPSVFLVPGFQSTDPSVDGAAAFREHLQTHYHRPSDDLSRPIDWDSALRFARVNVRIGYAVAQQDGRPTWNEGDFFGEKFGK